MIFIHHFMNQLVLGRIKSKCLVVIYGLIKAYTKLIQVSMNIAKTIAPHFSIALSKPLAPLHVYDFGQLDK